jgi:hypothetical protein
LASLSSAAGLLTKSFSNSIHTSPLETAGFFFGSAPGRAHLLGSDH